MSYSPTAQFHILSTLMVSRTASRVSWEMSRLSLTTLNPPAKSRCLLDTHAARSLPSVWRKGGQSSPIIARSPDAIPIRRSLQIARSQMERGFGQIRSLRTVTNKLPTLDCGHGWLDIRSQTALGSSFPRSVPPLRHKHTTAGATPTSVAALHVKAQIRCLGGIVAPRTGSSRLGRRASLARLRPCLPTQGGRSVEVPSLATAISRHASRIQRPSHCRSSASHESAMLQLK